MKELFLLRGVPGSGKTALANSIGGTWVEADHYFLNENGDYEFDASKLKYAHKWCQDSVEESMSFQSIKITVSNTFTQEWEMQPYFDLAEKYGYRVYSLNDLNSRLANTLRSKISKNLKRLDSLKDQNTLSIVGLDSWDCFRKHIENKFESGMNWDNYGIGQNNTTWHIDHIIPISSAKTLEEVKKLSHYSNLRPMWGSDNIRKSNKMLGD
jgi:hypothetical protein